MTQATPKDAATLKAVAQRTGLSITTVSRVLRGRHREARISEATCARVEAAALQAGYHPHRQAQGLRLGKSNLLGVCVVAKRGAPSNNASEMLKGICYTATRHNLATVAIAADNVEDDLRAVDRFLNARVDGIVYQQRWNTPEISQRLNHLHDRGVPVITVHDRDAGCRCPYVGGDYVLGGQMVTEHLLSLGHRRIAYLGLTPDPPSDLRRPLSRYQGYLLAMRRHDLPPLAFTTPGTFYPDAAQAAARLLAARPSATAVVCFNDKLALATRHAAIAAGLSVPRDLAITGYDESEAALYADLPLTSVEIPFYDIGRRAVERILGIGCADPEELLPPILHVRASSGGALAPQQGGRT
ncbi:MAG TPA: LacI family DNA-binding transcriptional regulator [Candidatus Brocadiia bacterium]|nr:LacI family DNA-binding transcriptional regulator [Candidatus Brocadiia bacterium]